MENCGNWIRRRIGTTINVRWGEILLNGGDMSLSSCDLTLTLTDPIGFSRVMPFTLDGNTISFIFYGVEQKHCGAYRVSLWVDYGTSGKTLLRDFLAFVLVSKGEDASGDGLSSEAIEIDGATIYVGVQGESLYEMMVRTGRFIGTEEEFLEKYEKAVSRCEDIADDAEDAIKQFKTEAEKVMSEASEAAKKANDAAVEANNATEEAKRTIRTIDEQFTRSQTERDLMFKNSESERKTEFDANERKRDEEVEKVVADVKAISFQVKEDGYLYVNYNNE